MGRYIYKPGLPVRVKPGVIGKLKTVVEKSVSGDPVHLTDAAKDLPARDLAAAIRPVQDLHGYDAPWPAGGGKNLLKQIDYSTTTPAGITFTTTAAGALTFSGTASETISFFVNENLPLPAGTYKLNGMTDGSNTTYALRIRDKNDTSNLALQYTTDAEITFASDTSAQIQVFVYGGATVDKTIYPMVRLSSVSDGTWAPYENICPITGRTGVKVTRTGKNLLPNEITQAVTEKDVTFEPTDDGGIYIHGINSGNLWQTNICQNLSLKAGEYIISIGNNLPTNGLVQITNRANNYVYCSILSSETYKNFTVTKAMENDMRVRFATSGGTGIEFNVTVYPMIRLASIDDADFEPYQGKTVTVDLDGTIYGGEYDVTTGVLTVDKVITDMSALSWDVRYTGNNNKTVSASLSSAYPSDYHDYSFISESYEYKGYINQISTLSDPDNSDIGIWSYWNAGAAERVKVYVVLDKNTSPSGNLVYEIASPFTVQLTAGEEVRMLGGENNLWADTGSVRLDYYGDIQ